MLRTAASRSSAAEAGPPSATAQLPLNASGMPRSSQKRQPASRAGSLASQAVRRLSRYAPCYDLRVIHL